MAVDQLEVQPQPALGALQLLQLRAKALAPARRAQARAARRLGIAAQATQFAQQGVGVRPGQREDFLVHHRVGKACAHQHVAKVVHVDEGCVRGRPAPPRIDLAQAVQRARAQRREHQEATHRQRPLPLLQQRHRVGGQMQHHVGPQQLRLTRSHLLRRGPGEFRPGPAPGRPPRRGRGSATTLQQRSVGLDTQHARVRIGLLQQ